MGEDQIEPGYRAPGLTVPEYKEKYNSLPAVKESNLLLVSRSINSVKTALLIITIVIVFFLLAFLTMGYTGVFKPQMNVTCEKTVCSKIPTIPACPTFTCPSYSCTIYQNGTNVLNFTFDNETNLIFNDTIYYKEHNIINYTFEKTPAGDIIWLNTTYYLNPTIENCTNDNSTVDTEA
jgi:hypothetical protein